MSVDRPPHPGYADVVAGRLVLLDATTPPPVLLHALREMAPGAALTLADALARGGRIHPEVLRRVRANLPAVLQAERERTLARLLHQEQVAPPERILGLFEQVRQAGFQRELGTLAIAAGLVSRERIDALYARAEAALARARARRAAALGELLRGLPSPAAADLRARLAAVFQLCEGDLRLDEEAPPPPPPPTATPGAATLSPAPPGGPAPLEGDPLRAARQGDLAPEECPIYGYEIVSELGKGSMGVVYKARHVTTGRMTALKVLPLRLAAKTQYLERFKREAMALMRLEHENIVRGYDFGGSEDYYYLALEFVEGETLDKVLQRDVCLTERQTLDIGRQVARGLGCAASHGVIHRDVKPENIILTPQGVAKLVDFGIVKLADLEEGTITVSGTTVGTPYYIAPEQARGDDELDVRSDLYSLGITLFHLATGRVPFTGKSQGAILVRHILEEVPDPRSVRSDLSESFAGIIHRLTRKRPEDRFPSAEEAAEAIDAVLGVRAPARSV